MAQTLVPKSDFVNRKVWAWVFIGPANPIFWLLAYPLQGDFNPFGGLGFFTIAPCSLGVALLLFRLRAEPIVRGSLGGRVFAWAFATIFWYTVAIAVCLLLLGLMHTNSGLGDPGQVILLLMYSLPFAYLVGTIPACVFALITTAIVEGALYEPHVAEEVF